MEERGHLVGNYGRWLKLVEHSYAICEHFWVVNKLQLNQFIMAFMITIWRLRQLFLKARGGDGGSGRIP